SSDEEAIGRLREYRIERKIGQGGMGAVYEATHVRLRRKTALKLILSRRLDDPSSLPRFEREMEAIGRLDHPNVIRAYDAGEVGGRHYLAMEFIEGLNLFQLIKRNGPLPIPEACEIIRQAAEGLQHANENGFVHRDVKPSNLFLARDGVVKVLDLGLALPKTSTDAVESSHAAEDTKPGQLLGTLDYMAPEQVGNSHEVDARADVYGLGCTFHALLTGSGPFSGPEFKTPARKIHAHATATPPDLCEQRSDAPPKLAKLLERMLAKRPEDRPNTLGEVAQELESLAEGVQLAPLLSGLERGDALPNARNARESRSNKSRITWTLVSGIAAAACALLAVSAWFGRVPTALLSTSSTKPRGAATATPEPSGGGSAFSTPSDAEVITPEPSDAEVTSPEPSDAASAAAVLPSSVVARGATLWTSLRKKKRRKSKEDVEVVADEARESDLTVAALDFEASDPGNPKLGQEVGDLLSAMLSGAPGFRLVDRTSLARTLEEAELNLSGLVSPDQTIQIGRLTGAKILVTGRVFPLGKKMFVTAKLIGVETSLAESVAVSTESDGDLGEVVVRLAEEIAQRIRESGPRLVASDEAGQDPLPDLQAQLKKRELPRVAVVVVEHHHASARRAGPAVDPAVETEIKRLLTQTGFIVQDVKENDLIKWANAPDNVNAWPRGLNDVDVVIAGEAFSEFTGRIGKLVSCSARAEINVIHKSDGRIFLASRTTARAVDLSENLAGKTALQKAGRVLGVEILRLFANPGAEQRVPEKKDVDQGKKKSPPKANAPLDEPNKEAPEKTAPAAPREKKKKSKATQTATTDEIARSPLVIRLSNQGYWIGGRSESVTFAWATDQPIVGAEARWTLAFGALRIASGSARFKKKDRPKRIMIALPAARARSEWRLSCQLFDSKGAALDRRREIPVRLFPDNLLDAAARIVGQRKITLWGPDRGLSETLAKAGIPFQRIDDSSKLRFIASDVILVDANQINDVPFAQARLIAYAKAGAGVMLFQQTAPKTLAGYAIVPRTIVNFQWRMKDPLLRGFLDRDPP
ncbi:MAG: protein kinase, partial [Planctomycetales bacterium]